MMLSLDVDKFQVTSHVSQNHSWIALEDHRSNQGVYVSVYFKSVEEIDALIDHLEALKVKIESEAGV